MTKAEAENTCRLNISMQNLSINVGGYSTMKWRINQEIIDNDTMKSVTK